MAKLQRISGADLKGEAFPLRMLRFPHELERGALMTDVLEEIEIDDETNAALILDIANNPKDYALESGVLKKRGQTVNTTADGGYRRAIKMLDAIEQKADSGTFADNAQRDRAIGALARILKRLVNDAR